MYKPAKIDFTKSQIEKAIKGKPVRVHSSQLNKGNNVILLHPTNYKLIEKSIKKGKGVTLYLAPGEFQATIDSDLEGTGFLDWIKNKALPWLKKNAPILKPIASAIADVGAPMLGPKGTMARQLLKETTGIGAMNNVDKMAKVRAAKKKKVGEGLYLGKRGGGLYL